MGGPPYVIYPRITATPGQIVPFGLAFTSQNLPQAFSTSGAPIFASGNSRAKSRATLSLNVNRFITDMAALSPGHQLSPLSVSGIAPYFQNGYIGTWTAGLKQKLAGITIDAAYVGTAGIKLPVMDYLNAYLGASAAYTPYTQYNSSGVATGGYGLMQVMTNRSHSTYHALQMSAQRDLTATGLGFQMSYTHSKSIDDTSAVVGGFISGSSGAVAQTIAEDPNNFRLDKGPSPFDIKMSLP